jgi:flagellar motility protein MotE (MotC chaperone)
MRWRPRLLPLAMLAMAGLLLVRGLALHEGVSGPGFIAPAAANAPPAQTPAAGAMPLNEAGAAAPIAPEPGSAAAADPAALAERALLENLRARRTALDTRETEIAQREMLLSATERRVIARVEELAALQQALEAETSAQDERVEQRLRQLVRLYEAMRPRDASVIFNELDMEVLIPVLARMREARAAPVLAAMLPERARLATTELARLRARLAP